MEQLTFFQNPFDAFQAGIQAKMGMIWGLQLIHDLRNLLQCDAALLQKPNGSVFDCPAVNPSFHTHLPFHIYLMKGEVQKCPGGYYSY
ncbi:hypothetical protein D3C75_1123670 [compost metagenome]